METINYIKHLNAVFEQFYKDKRLNTTHISLYMALFQLWNNNFFKGEFYFNREEVMEYAKIGSKSTYHRCIKELSHWNYFLYMPSHNPFKGSRIMMFDFGSSTEQALNQSRTEIGTGIGKAPYLNGTENGTSDGQALVSKNKHIQTVKNNKNLTKLDEPKNENEVIEFFKKENFPELEAKKFYNHYQGIGWKIGGKTKIVDWHATARNWILKADELNERKKTVQVNQNAGQVNQKTDYLKTSVHKNYNEPL